jgi:hypothetical protein
MVGHTRRETRLAIISITPRNTALVEPFSLTGSSRLSSGRDAATDNSRGECPELGDHRDEMLEMERKTSTERERERDRVKVQVPRNREAR